MEEGREEEEEEESMSTRRPRRKLTCLQRLTLMVAKKKTGFQVKTVCKSGRK